MAWPCISRVCCLARFWHQFDKSDLSVPLTVQNYSDPAEREVRSVTQRVSSSTPGSHRAPTDGPGSRSSFRSRTEPSSQPPEDYRPFPSVTQYKQDFKPWPIPRKEDFPWITGASRAEAAPDCPADGRGGREERRRAQQWEELQGTEERKTTSYRQEFKPWTGVRSAKGARRNAPAQTEVTHASCETSYQAAYSGEAQRSTGPGEPGTLPANSHTQTAAGALLIPTGLQAGSSAGPPGATRVEERPVRTKPRLNPSAVFQSGSRVFNI